MNIDWAHFTPSSALLGGLMIGLAAAVLLLMNGRIAGISGIFGGLLRPQKKDSPWRLAFLIGLIAAPALYSLFAIVPDTQIDAGYALLTLAGLSVGIGTRYASGCTSGHGVCGLSRLSPRSALATLVFMGAGFATVFVLRQFSGM